MTDTAKQSERLPAYADLDHPTNKIRPRLKCWNCGTKGVVGKHWGQWCFKCNNERLGHLNGQFDKIRAALKEAQS
jgi:hypothetical protein